MENNINENLRELCAAGDLQLIKSYIEKNKPDLNSKNKVNGWTALHWACKRNFFDIVKFLVENGASDEIVNTGNKKPSFYATNHEILEYLYDKNKCSSLNEQKIVKEEEFKDVTKSEFVPNFLKHPDFSHLRHFNSENVEIKNDKIKTMMSDDKSLITIKIRVHLELDFIEVDLIPDKTSFEEFKKICIDELELKITVISKIRKLPNILIRNDKDVKRLKDGQEIEIIV